ncbi:hypothetical protein [Kitasatospora sp. MAA4]|uniref:hypothetical protein n=1 Tax=Kitasatospora sp. MAA4 TaxID=3035093 RepID=UPI002473BA09|nr:hypothetical protein [Kitasatospora sp. MAA4]
MYDGQVVPSAIILSHEEQLVRLEEGCPPAVPVAVVAGDPCIDQLRAGLAFRDAYRQAFGVLSGQKLVVLSSTWGAGSILGAVELQVMRRVLAELPADEYRIVAAVHPNAWFSHGAWQIRHWLAELTEAGLCLPAPDSDVWKAALVAADVVVGDHGSVTLYGVALGVPCLLGAFDEAKVAPGSPMERLGRIAPRLSPGRGVLDQVVKCLSESRGNEELAAVGELVTSRPGAAAQLLRRVFYERIGLAEPAAPARTKPIALPGVEALGAAPLSPVTPAMYVTATVADTAAADGPSVTVLVRRYPARLQGSRLEHLGDAHLVADRHDPDPSWPSSADVLLVASGRARRGVPAGWSELAGPYAGSWLVAEEELDGGCLGHLRDGRSVVARWVSRPQWAGFAIAASVLYTWAVEGSGEGWSRARVVAGEDMEDGVLDIGPA